MALRALFLALALGGCAPDGPCTESLEGNPAQSLNLAITLEGITVNLASWTLLADRAELTGDEVRLVQPKATLEGLSLLAGQARFRIGQQTLTLSPRVEAKINDMAFQAGEATISPGPLVESSGPVTLTTPQGKINAESFSYQQDNVVLQGVSARMDWGR